MSDLYNIAASGMAVQRMQMDLIAENLANAGVVRADGSVFHPKTAVVQSGSSFEAALREAGAGSDEDDDAYFSFDGDAPVLAPQGVSVASIIERDQGGQFRYDPGNPFASKSGPHKGYVSLPNVDPIEEMIALISSGRTYDANVSMLQAAKQMDLEAADVGRA